MNAIKTVKKMVSLGIGLTMVGATIFGATAYKLSDYPAPFVVDGVPASNLAVIVGDAADASDVVGMGDIISALQASSVVRTPVPGATGTGVVVEGDAVEIGSTSDLLELNETIGDVRETITEVDLNMLRGGQIVTDEGSTEYNQYLRFNTSTAFQSGKVVFDEDERDRVGHYLFWNDPDIVFEWQLEFEEGLESETEGGDLVDLEDEDIIVLGQPYVIVDTDYENNSNELTIEMMGGAVSAVLGENDKETYVVDGKEYEVEVVVISETAAGGEGSVKFRVNGEITDELEDGETDVLSDGTQVGIRDILATGKDIQKSIVQFYLGAYKLEFTDSEVNDTLFDRGGAEINEETLEDADVRIQGLTSRGGRLFEITDIQYRLFADSVLGDTYIPVGSGLREQLDEPEGMLAPNWDIRYEGLMDTGVSLIRIDAAGDDEYDLEFTNQEGIFYDFPLVSHETGTLQLGDDDDDLHVVESFNTANAQVSDNDFFVLSNCGPADNTCFTHVMRYDSVDTSNRVVTFTDLGVGTREVTYANATRLASLTVGGIAYALYVNDTTPFNISIDMNGDGDWAGDQTLIGIQGDGLLQIGTNGNQSDNKTLINANKTLGVLLVTLSREFDEGGLDENVTIEIVGRPNQKIGINRTTTANISTGDSASVAQNGNTTLFGPFDLEENEDLTQAMTKYGVFFELFDPSVSDEAEDMTVEYPLSQRGARVFVTGGLVTTKEVAGGAFVERVNPIPVGASLLASDVEDVTDYNAVLVGGPCANQIAAQLMGNPTPCHESVPENKAIIKLYEHANKNVALLVAGRSADNTRQAARAVATGELGSIDSEEAEVSGASLRDITVRAV